MMKYSLAEKIQEFRFNLLHRTMFFFDKNGPNRLRRKQDSGWSSDMYVCAFVWQAVNMGIFLNFGVLFLVIMERFNSWRQDTCNTQLQGRIWVRDYRGIRRYSRCFNPPGLFFLISGVLDKCLQSFIIIVFHHPVTSFILVFWDRFWFSRKQHDLRINFYA